MSKDSLGDRMKRYEDANRHYLYPRSFTILRVDGKAFHTYTRKFKRPFDEDLVNMMNQTAAYLCSQISGAKLAYVQSDEISIIITDFDTHETQSWFDGNIQKFVSVSASMATAKFNRLRYILEGNVEDIPLAQFDSRVFQIPARYEVYNYLLWRQQDATRNSISSVAQSLYFPRELNGKNMNLMQEMIFQKGINWNDYPDGLKRGRCVVKTDTELGLRWTIVDPPVFSKNWDWLSQYIPDNI